jgi:hypothetical protein
MDVLYIKSIATKKVEYSNIKCEYAVAYNKD